VAETLKVDMLHHFGISLPDNDDEEDDFVIAHMPVKFRQNE
jgi:hypothetical protein